MLSCLFYFTVKDNNIFAWDLTHEFALFPSSDDSLLRDGGACFTEEMGNVPRFVYFKEFMFGEPCMVHRFPFLQPRHDTLLQPFLRHEFPDFVPRNVSPVPM